MKKMKKIFALLIAMVMVLGMSTMVFAAGGTPSITITHNTEDYDTANVAIDYTYYKILTASIDTDPVVNEADGSTTTKGTVAYYVEIEAQATALTGTGLFNVTKVDGQNKWYVELKDSSTTAAQIVEKFKDATFLSNFTKQEYTKPEGTSSAVLPGVTAGYYYIESSIGTNAAVQTLSPVTIVEKNSYPSLKKEYDGTAIDFDKSAIGTELPYKITVEIPAAVAEKDLTIVDTITKGLTLDTAVNVAGSDTYTSATFVLDSTDATTGVKTYKIVIPAATVKENAGKTLVFTYKATVNEQAIVLEPETNTGHLEYDNGVTPPSPVTTKTLAFDIQKVDGTDHTTILTGAEFKLYDAETEGKEIKVVKLNPATSTLADGTVVNMYRVATANETGVVIEGGTARIEGLNDQDYYLEETKAPTGYNKLETRVKITASETTSTTDIDLRIDNNKGSTLPSTGGIGTTIFYIIGAILVIGAGVVLVTRRRMNK